jgi:hypothetical protein
VFVTTHVLAGALIGRSLGRHPVGAFAVGVASHFAMDACPHYGGREPQTDAEWTRWFHMASCDGCLGLAAMAVGAGITPGPAKRAVVAGMAGAALPDLDKPFDWFFGWAPFPQAWQRFHSGVQNQEANRLPLEILYGAALAAAAWKVLR